MRIRHRNSNDLRRKTGRRQPRERILIVCEGEKTECNYFDEIRQEARLSAATILTIPSHLGTDPENIIRAAEDRFKSEGKAFDRVYAVFDRDEHMGYANALAMAQAKDGRLYNSERKAIEFKAIPSVPCFELWLLIHYVQTQGPIHRRDVLSRLRTQWPGYAKNIENIYKNTKSMLVDANRNASQTRQNTGPIPGEDCYTEVDQLVEILLNLNT
jgi:RloB-like protein